MSIITATRALARHRRLNRLEAAAYIAQLEGQNTALTAKSTTLEAQLDEAAIDISGLGHDLRVARGENLRLDGALTATNASLIAVKAQLANATAIKPLPQHVSTQPIPTVQQRFETGPVIRIGASPTASTDPGHVSDLAATQPIPRVEAPAA